MKRCEILRLAASGAVAWAAGTPAGAETASVAKPNILYILMDDLGWMDTGVYGGRRFSTPNVDRLAAEGMRFTDAYAASPLCSPTRASIMTGKHPARLHLTDYIPGRDLKDRQLLVPAWTKELKAGEVTLAEILASAGYATAAVGKWHLGGRPVDHGFREQMGVTGGSPPPNVPDLSEQQADAAIRFIEANKAGPFFCYLAFNAVHRPLSPRPELLEKNAAKTDPDKPKADYLAVMEDCDAQIGRVLKVLDELDLAEKTIVIFVSDNGGFILETTNAPLRGGKAMLYEGGIRVPMIVRWPGVVQAGSICSVPVSTVDHYPTLLEAAGTAGDAAHNKTVDGVSLMALLKGRTEPRREALYWHYPHYHPGPPYPHNHFGPPSGAIRAGDWKLIEFYEDGRVELYNLKNDIGESADLSAKMPEKALELKEKLDAWRRSVDAQMPVPNPDFGRAPAVPARGSS